MFKRIFTRIRLLFSTKSARRKRWPVVPELTSSLLENCKVVPNRIKMLDLIPSGGTVAELGILNGDFSEQILQKVKPEKLYLIDIDSEAIRSVSERFSHLIESGGVVAVHQDSSEFLEKRDDLQFDWIYIDGDHSYHGIIRDLEAAHHRLKPGGLISLNDYIFFGASDLRKYGVIEATNEFCLRQNYEIIYLALQGRMYNDVTIRKIPATAMPGA